jgi:predicted nicotinamide N-methyase
MHAPTEHRRLLRTTVGDFPLHEFRLRLGGLEWSVLHTGDVFTLADEQSFLKTQKERLPYGVVLWPSAVALAHDLATRAESLRGTRVLELGAGTGLPGIVAASLGARVVQTDRQQLALSMCKRNGMRNGVETVDYREADWTQWSDPTRYDWIIGSDILYAETMHGNVKHIFETNLAPGGRVLIADPFRAPSVRFMESLEGSGWTVTMSKWSVGENGGTRSIGVFELRPRAAD